MHESDLKTQARLIFAEALEAVDSGKAVRQAVYLSNDLSLTIVDKDYQLTENTPIYAIAIGKAAYPMAIALDDILDDRLKSGVISGVVPEDSLDTLQTKENSTLSSKWRIFAGGHPLPNEASLSAAQSCFDLLESANNEQTIIIFLISGGGSAMMESPIDESISLADLREANRILVSCGALITEINAIRRSFSRVKGGGLAAIAPRATQISLIISDTETGDEKSVASGLTFEREPLDSEEINSIIERHGLSKKLPNSIIRAITQKSLKQAKQSAKNIHRHYVLLDNQTALEAAAKTADSYGFMVEIADDISQQNVETGCRELIQRMKELCKKSSVGTTICLISGGEFSCPVRGNGTGGRNLETVLRIALLLDKSRDIEAREVAFLSAGTDGIDGNSPAAGAVCHTNTTATAKALGLDALHYLENSDSYSFFEALGDAIITNPTGTNVRDLRIMLARK